MLGNLLKHKVLSVHDMVYYLLIKTVYYDTLTGTYWQIRNKVLDDANNQLSRQVADQVLFRIKGQFYLHR